MALMRKPVSARRSIKKTKTGRYKTKSAARYYTPPTSRTLTGGTAPGRITGLSATDFGFPDRLRTKVQYCDVVQLTASAGNPAVYQFRMNGLYDPDYTGTGHQPQWTDQLFAVYNRYVVNNARIIVTFCPNHLSTAEADDRGPYIVGINTTAGTATFGAGSYPALLEDGNTVHGVIVTKEGGNNKLTLSNTYSPMRDIGLSTSDDTLQSQAGTDPSLTRTLFANLFALDMTHTTLSQSVCAVVKIVYDVTFMHRKENVVS